MTARSTQVAVSILLFMVGCQHHTRRPSNIGLFDDPPVRNTNLQALIDATKDNGTVHIPLGTYVLSEPLRVVDRKHLVIRCDAGTRILLEDPNKDVLVVDSSRSIRIENGYFRHVQPLPTYACHGGVIAIRNSQDTTIFNAELNGCGANGVNATGAEKLTIQNCFIHHNSFNALYFSDSQEILVVNNIIEDNAGFLQTSNVRFLQVYNNVIRRNGGYWKPWDPTPGVKGQVLSGSR